MPSAPVARGRALASHRALVPDQAGYRIAGMKASGVGFADMVEAHAALKPSSVAAEAIARMCGFEVQPQTDERDASRNDDNRAGPEDLDMPSSVPPPVPAELQALPPSVHRLQPVRQDTRRAVADPITTQVAPAARPVPQFEGLLTERDGIELMRMASSVSVPTDRIDVERAVARLASALPLTELPMLRMRTLAFGAQVLVDVGQSMQQFFKDQTTLLERVEGNLRKFADIRYFADDPMRGCGSERRRYSWREYQLPYPQVPVVALTDLGCGYPLRPLATRAWMRLADLLKKRKSRVVVFAPISLARIPGELARIVDLVLWDRSSVRRNVMQLVGARDE
jgi:hypothetical protein